MMIDGNQKLVSNGCKSLDRLYVFDKIKAGNITDIMLIPTTPNVAKNTA